MGVSLLGGPVRYRSPRHEQLPHVVKLSGGRSSAAMALSLARCDLLRPERGDVALFANTSAEHPATYRFAARVCDELEREHGLPCFWYEFCTVETAGHRGYGRSSSYRLVSRRPVRSNDGHTSRGYCSDGSVFEELVSWRTMLPDRHRRFCTQYLKVTPGVMLLSEWFGGGPGPAHAGHYHERVLATAEALTGRYRGALDSDKHHAMVTFVAGQPPARPAQRWQDFTTVNLNRPADGPRPQADLWGVQGSPIQYVTMLGLRSDESKRVDRMLLRGIHSEGAVTGRCKDRSQPAGEYVYAPLADSGADKKAVASFWGSEMFDLQISSARGNCVFCFMKRPPALSHLARLPDPQSRNGEPSQIGWWANLEDRYSRPSTSRPGVNLGFFDIQSGTFDDIANPPVSSSARGRTVTRRGLPCVCSD